MRPELQGKVIDDLGNPHSTSLSAFMLLLVVFLGMLLLNYLMNYVQRYIVAVISEEIAADMRQKVEDKLSTVSVNFFEKIKLSDILLKVDKDVSAVKQCGITSIITLVSNIVILVVVPPYMFSIHKGIAVSNIILLVSVPFISRILGKLIQETSGQVLEGYNSITNVLTNTYDNWFITRLFQCGQYVHDMYFEKNQKYKKAAALQFATRSEYRGSSHSAIRFHQSDEILHFHIYPEYQLISLSSPEYFFFEPVSDVLSKLEQLKPFP